MVKNYRIAVAVGGALLVLAAVAACSQREAEEPLQGIVEFEERALGFEVPGRIERLDVGRGDLVQEGDVLAVLDAGLARHARDVRAADLAAAKARADLLRAGSRGQDTRALAAQLDAARAVEDVARKAVERERQLNASGASTAVALDKAESDLRRAEGERRALEERLAALREGARAQELLAAEAQVAAATAALALEEERLARHVLRAPAPGRVLDVTVEPGEIVGAATPVVLVADTGHPYVDVFVSQGKIDGLSIGDPARARVDASDASFSGVVEDVGRRTEFTPRFLFSERERPNLVIRVRVRFDDPDERLHAGVPARVWIDMQAGSPVARSRQP